MCKGQKGAEAAENAICQHSDKKKQLQHYTLAYSNTWRSLSPMRCNSQGVSVQSWLFIPHKWCSWKFPKEVSFGNSQVLRMNSADNLAQVRTNILCIHKYIKTYLFFWSQKLCGNNMHLNYRLNSLCNIPTIDYARKKSSRVILSDVEGLPTRFLWGLEAHTENSMLLKYAYLNVSNTYIQCSCICNLYMGLFAYICVHIYMYKT